MKTRMAAVDEDGLLTLAEFEISDGFVSDLVQVLEGEGFGIISDPEEWSRLVEKCDGQESGGES